LNWFICWRIKILKREGVGGDREEAGEKEGVGGSGEK
jgi:hypothetical protein